MVGRAIESISSITAWAGACASVAMMALIFIDVVLRYVFDSPLLFADEVSVYLMLFVAFIGAAGTMKAGRHIRIEILLSRLRPKTQLWLDLITCIMSLVVMNVVLWQVIIWVHKTYVRGFTAPSVLLTPMWIPQLILPVGLSIFSLQLMVETYKAGKALRAVSEKVADQELSQ